MAKRVMPAMPWLENHWGSMRRFLLNKGQKVSSQMGTLHMAFSTTH